MYCGGYGTNYTKGNISILRRLSMGSPDEIIDNWGDTDIVEDWSRHVLFCVTIGSFFFGKNPIVHVVQTRCNVTRFLSMFGWLGA